MRPAKLHVSLYGGLGNQLFQIGSALAISRNLQDRLLVLNYWRLNSYDSVHPKVLDKIIDLTSQNISVRSKLSLIGGSRIARVVGLKMANFAFINDQNLLNTFATPRNYRWMYFDGYFQDVLDDKIFNEVRSQLLKIVSPGLLLAKENNNNRLVIHIRGGDFLLHPHGSVCDRKYYQSALEVMRDTSNFEDIVVVTDDPEYSEKLLKDLGIKKPHLISNIDPFEDFLLISMSKLRILSNSTFCLWASELGNNPIDGAVISPKYFYPGNRRNFKLTNEIKLGAS